MVRLFHVYFPVRTLVLLFGEALVVCASFLAATYLILGPDAYIALNYEFGVYKILLVAAVAMLCSYYFDLYAPEILKSGGEIYFRLLVVLSVMSFVLAALSYFFPALLIAGNVNLYGLGILTLMLLTWRRIYAWLIQQPIMMERVYVLGAGDRAQRLVEAIRSNKEWGIDVVGWAGALGNGETSLGNGETKKEEMAKAITSFCSRSPVDRVIVAITDRRGTMPVRELLDLKLKGVKIEEANTLLEKISGRIEVEDLHPSAVIYSPDFRVNQSLMFARRTVSIIISLVGLILCLPIIPIVALIIKLDSKGPVFFSQERVGYRGHTFQVHKFRTMRTDAEVGGAKWAKTDDPRITRIGKFLRRTRLDEIPQLWNVLVGDMGFVGPRPERPEFVQWLAEAIPYYNLRHIIRPGLTGWAQVRYEYGASLEQTREKLQYDLYYIKHMSLSLDLIIIFETIKTVILRKGSR